MIPMADCGHERLDYLYANVWWCRSCDGEIQLEASDFGGPDTLEEARGDK